MTKILKVTSAWKLLLLCCYILLSSFKVTVVLMLFCLHPMEGPIKPLLPVGMVEPFFQENSFSPKFGPEGSKMAPKIGFFGFFEKFCH